jgi:hypothetical protein
MCNNKRIVEAYEQRNKPLPKWFSDRYTDHEATSRAASRVWVWRFTFNKLVDVELLKSPQIMLFQTEEDAKRYHWLVKARMLALLKEDWLFDEEYEKKLHGPRDEIKILPPGTKQYFRPSLQEKDFWVFRDEFLDNRELIDRLFLEMQSDLYMNEIIDPAPDITCSTISSFADAAKGFSRENY